MYIFQVHFIICNAQTINVIRKNNITVLSLKTMIYISDLVFNYIHLSTIHYSIDTQMNYNIIRYFFPLTLPTPTYLIHDVYACMYQMYNNS